MSWWTEPYPKGPRVDAPELPRPLKAPLNQDGKITQGTDVLAYKRAISHAQRLLPWDPDAWNESFSNSFARGSGTADVGESGVRGFQRQEWPSDESAQTGNIGERTYERMCRTLIPTGPNQGQPIFDSVCLTILREFEVPTDDYCFPVSGTGARPTFFHETSGLDGNWALDFMCPGGTPFHAPEDSEVTRFSGRDPADGVYSSSSFGWSMYLETVDGYEIYNTHLGMRIVDVGDRVTRGQQLGEIGHWPNDPGRSHLHEGASAPDRSESAAKGRMTEYSQAPRE